MSAEERARAQVPRPRPVVITDGRVEGETVIGKPGLGMHTVEFAIGRLTHDGLAEMLEVLHAVWERRHPGLVWKAVER